MRNLPFAVALLTFMGHVQQAQPSSLGRKKRHANRGVPIIQTAYVGQERSGGRLDALESLAMVLWALNPTTSFNPSTSVDKLFASRPVSYRPHHMADELECHTNSRRDLVQGLASLWVSSLLLQPFAAHASITDEIKKTASLVPGYGPPDLLFPPVFRGRWRVTRTVADVQTPLGRDKAPREELGAAEQAAAAAPIQYDQIFVVTDDADYGERVILDRAFNAEQREAALTGLPVSAFQARWSASNPNVLTVSNSRTGSVIETKVTKRSTEPPGEGAFGTSEYCRIADAGSTGVVSSVPRILASRTRIRYKWDAANPSPSRIEAIALENLFDPTQTGFADLAGATPVLTLKVRLVFDKK